MLTSGSRLGKYRIERALGQGGAGTVFLAYDSTLERHAAVKLLEGRGDGPAERARILREARTASALNHPNICTIYEVGEEGGRAFIAMEHVDGQPLSALIGSGGVPVEDAVRYGTEAADALAHAHDRGVVHGDLKAANAIIAVSGRLKIVDFGLARRIEHAEPDITTLLQDSAAGLAVGTPYAMAPEQVRGAAADTLSDVWSLGVLLFEMLAGGRPFGASTVAELFSSILRDPPAAVSPHVPEPLREIVQKCLAKNPGQRYQRAADVRLVLELMASGLRKGDRTPSGTAVAVGEPMPRPPILEITPASDFVGRASELQQLERIWSDAKSGRRQLVLLAGEPGIGKTRLALTFAASCADTRATVLVGHSDEEALIPYQPFVEALTWFARVCPDSELRSHLAAAGGGAELGQLVPEVLRRCPDLPTPLVMNAESQRYRLFEAVSGFLAAASASHPILLLLDDLHWADKPTLLMLRHLMRAPARAGLCTVGTYRESEVDRAHPFGEMLADLRRELSVTRMSLRGLDQQQVRGLVHSVLGQDAPPNLSAAVGEITGGNPFFVGETLRHIKESGAITELLGKGAEFDPAKLGLPEGVKEVIGRRLSRTSEHCNRVLTLAAVIGREFDVAVLEALGDFPDDQLLDSIDEAVAAHLVAEAPGGRGRFSFQHALIRQTLYGELTSSRRARLHRRIGEALERLTQGRPSQPLADLAYHFTQAAPGGHAEKAIDYATRAGDRAADALAYEEAARFYDMALQSLEFGDVPDEAARRVDLHTRRAQAFGSLALWAAEQADVDLALQFLPADQIERRAELLLMRADSSFYLLDIPGVRKFASSGLELAERVQRSDLAADAMGWLARCLQAGGELDKAIDMDRAAIGKGLGRKGVATMHAPLTLYLAGRADEAVAAGEQAYERARSSRDTEFAMFALSHYALALSGTGRYADADRVFGEARQFGRRHGVLPPLARAMAMQAGLHLAVFDFEGAEALQREARELAQSLAFTPTLVSATIDLLLTFARRNEPGRAENYVDQVAGAIATAPGWHEWLWTLRLRQARAELALARDELDVAASEATTCVDMSRARGRPKYHALGLITRARARHRQARTREAIGDALMAVEVARQSGDPALQLAALSTLLDLEGSDQLVAEALALCDRIRRALPSDVVQRRFDSSEMVQRIGRLTR
jgi:predicted Ser/Thr protein kinase/tetratricopeptide (TPR) repeat protein